MVVAPWLYPPREILQSIESEARGPPELLLHIGHVFHWAPFFDAQHLLLVWEEVGEKFFFHLYPFCLLEGGDIVSVVDLEGMLKVLLPPSTPVFGSHPYRIMRGSSHMTAPLGQGTLRCCSWGNVGRYPRGEITLLMRHLLTGLLDGGLLLCFPGATGRSATVIPTSGTLSPTALGSLTTSGSGFVSGGVESDSPPSRLAWQLYCLLVQSCWLAGWWLMERWCHLRSMWCQSRWHLSLMDQSPWSLCQLHLSVPFQSGPHLCRPPNGR